MEKGSGWFTSSNRREESIRSWREMKGNRGAGAATPDACVRLHNLYSHCSCVAVEEEEEDDDENKDRRSKGI